MAENGEKTIRVQLDDAALQEQWTKTLDGRQISQQRAVVALIRFITAQDALTQAMIFGQVPETDFAALSRIVLKRMAGEPTYQNLVTSRGGPRKRKA